MHRTDFTQRAHDVLARKVTQKQQRERRGLRRLAGIATALAGAVACFFLLKAATLAYMGEERFTHASDAAFAQDSGLGFWIAGIDPVTRVLAQAMTQGQVQAMRPDTRADL